MPRNSVQIANFDRALHVNAIVAEEKLLRIVWTARNMRTMGPLNTWMDIGLAFGFYVSECLKNNDVVSMSVEGVLLIQQIMEESND